MTKKLKKLSKVAIAVFAVSSLSSCFFFNSDECKDIEKECAQHDKEKKSYVSDINLDAYIENSGSIDGYVNGMNLFKTDTYALISNSVVNKANLYYINNSVFKAKGSARDFILNLTPASFKQNAGNRGYSDIADVIENATINSVKTPCLLVSDFIFSPDADHRQDVEKYFELQKNDVKNTVEKLLKKKSDIAVVVLKGESNFNGYYWNKDEVATKINQKRPFYAMLVGPIQQIALLMNKTKGTTHFKHGYSEFYPTLVDYKILTGKEDKVGNFRPCKNGKHHITKIQSEKRSSDFEFKVAVDFSNVPLNELYLQDKNNYSLSDKSYMIKSIIKSIIKSDDKKSHFTHVITIASTKKSPTSSKLVVTLKKNFPQWISDSQDSKGMEPIPGKTFGIQPLLEGIQLAYSDSKTDDDYYVKMKFILEK